MLTPKDKDELMKLISACGGFANILEAFADLAYTEGDKISMSDKIKSRHYYHLAVDLEPAIKSAIERGL